MVESKIYPFENNFHSVAGGHSMHYIDEGKGDPVVMVHGNPTWSFYYRNLVKQLSPNYRCIVPDHIGMGLSDKPGDETYDYTFRRRTDDLETLLDHLDAKRNITLVVHDWGGMIGFHHAVRYPERIARIVVLNTAAFHLPHGLSFPWQLKLVRDTSLIGPLLVRGLNAFVLGALDQCMTRRYLKMSERDAYLKPYNSWANRIAVLRFVEDIPLRPSDKGYEIIDIIQDGLKSLADKPMMIGWGAQDFIFNDGYLQEWKRRFPKAEVNEFEESGHFVLEDEREELPKLIDDFLARHPLPERAAAK